MTGKSTGTGVIVGEKNGKYYVLTSNHIVGIAPSTSIELPPNLGHDEKGLTNQEDPYQVITYDRKTYNVVYSEVEKDSHLDLAIITFDTANKKGEKYPVANLASSAISKNQKTFIYGFKDCFKKGRKEREEFNEGIVLSIENNYFDEGYTINYTNPTVKGMSGSPILNISGHVIAIHGKPGREDKGDSCDDSTLTEEFGNNYGISIESFKNSSLASKFQGKLSFDSKPIESVAPINNNSTSNDLERLDKSSSSPVRFKKSKD
ncbi:MAG: trypsin-like peptidase domain-containing protein [Richelia sp. RM2_1_2]|nr:trypsin-like peptidase domain-containing protein [Richelia sp. RM2_1_2]